MAKRNEQQRRKLELQEQISRQRAQITSQRNKLAAQIESKKEEIKEKFNVPKRIKNNIRSSFTGSPVKWFLGSAVGGLIVTKLILGKKGVKADSSKAVSTNVSRGLLTTSLLFIAKPIIKSLALKQGQTFLLKRLTARQQRLEATEYHDI